MKLLDIGETKITILPEQHAIKLNKIKNKTPVVIFNFKKIETRLQPNNEEIFYSTSSHLEINQIINYYPSIKEFQQQNLNFPLLKNDHWKEKVYELLNNL